ncbi:oxidoreductase [Aquincola sp. S2]|uniref:Oxidoreductase n=1 Tax=Pseudaquabacterium terrae TaxID=2732868 RepID=A0ABX2ENZ6_9BURK|nr:PDR/VanB family oxidoreductase [Aquabacterium terrae]NRF70377.1 oxidoreductase [Aquabacterium terrae]
MKQSTDWQSARITRITALSPTVREFEITSDAPFERWTPGAHLQLQIPARPGGGAETTRSYSLVGLPDAGVYRIAVKRLAASRGGSSGLHALAEGAALRVLPPHNHFELPPGARPTLLIAGGIGITPMVGMALALAARDAPLRVVYAAHSADELVYADLLRSALGERLASFAGDRGERLDLAAEIAALPADAQALVCGPLRLLHAVQAEWAGAGRPAAQLRFETFGAGGTQPAQAFRVKLPRHGLELEVPADRSLLDVLEAHGVAVLSDCRKGECGLCAIDVLAQEGECSVDHRDVFFSAAERHESRRLCACVSRAAGPGATLVLDDAWRADPAGSELKPCRRAIAAMG